MSKLYKYLISEIRKIRNRDNSSSYNYKIDKVIRREKTF